ncbi:hypothetical protein M426DRAFT_9995 [Hypoxylon sp. CI-4A]|nr:hypothetical protein M426DRAFT_9995 [Hypoxylon sp. CI-4A]
MPSKTEEKPTASADRSLGDSINIATRSVHTKLNKLIIFRLRLALPPQVEDASNYVQGLLHIAPIYITFESLWQQVLDSPTTEEGHTINSRISTLLSDLRIEGLARSDALKQDLSSLTEWSDDVLAHQLHQVEKDSSVLAEFLDHIRDTVPKRPHVLLSYAWVMYMAIFSGGRFIRASLERVDPSSAFWTPVLSEEEEDFEQPEFEDEIMDKIPGGFPSSSTSTTTAVKRRGSGWWKNALSPTTPPSLAGGLPGLRGLLGSSSNSKDQTSRRQQQQQQQQHPLAFFRFPTPSDGEDLKQTFKARMAASTRTSPSENSLLWLSPEERDDVVLEARRIFESMIGVVEDLDEVCGTEYEDDSAAGN